MTREEIIRMAREAGMEQDGDNFFSPSHEEIDVHITDLERFAALVEVHVNAREKERQRYDIHSCGPTCDRHICVAVRDSVEEEREECAKLCDHLWESKAAGAYECATAIRSKGKYE